MKTKLFTQDLFLGLLMALMLALGVQGTVDAVTTTLPEGPTVDLDANQVNGPIDTITFTPTLEDTADDPGVGDHTADPLPSGTDTTNTTETITVSTSGIQLTSPTFTTSVTFSESTTAEKQTNSNRPLDGTGITLSGYFTRVGVATLTIRYTDLSDRQANDGNQASEAQTSSRSRTHTYTYYVVRADSAIPETTFLRITQDGRSVNSEGYITGLNGRTDFYIQSGSGDYPVSYSVVPTASDLDTGPKFDDRADYTDETTIASRVRVWLDMNGAETFGPGATSVVTVNIGEAYASPRSSYNVAYIIGTPELDIGLTAATDVIADVDATNDEYSFTGGAAGDAAGTITATVTDGTGAAVPAGVLVKFDVVDKTVRGGYLSSTGTIVNNRNAIPQTTLSFGRTLYVRTATGGTATVTYELGTGSGEQEIRVTSVGKSQTVTAALASSDRAQKLFIKTNQKQSNTKKYDLVAEVKDEDDDPIGDMVVTFRTNRGTLTRVSNVPATGPIDTGKTVNVVSNAFGEAHVIYDIGEYTGRQEIHASIYDADDIDTTTIDERTLRQEVTFVINGPADTSGNQGSGASGNTISISPSTITGEAGTTQSLTVSAGTATVRVVDASAFTAAGGTISGSGATRSLTLPDTPGSNYTITLGASGYTDVTVPVIVTAAPANGTLTLTLGTRTGNQQPITVRAVRGGLARSGVNFTITGGVTSVSRQTGTDGRESAIVRLPTATGAHTLTVRATGYDPAEVRVPAVTGEPARDPSEPATARGTAGVADSIQVSGQVFRTGRLNTQLDLPLSVRVLDGNNTGVSGVKVTFRVQTGKGRLSQRGNGRATAVETDQSGYARAPYTPLARGTSTVRVNAAGVTQTVTFTITVNGASDPETATEGQTSDTPAPQTYNVRDEIPISRAATLSFSGSRTLNGMTYTCVGPGECVVSYGTVVKGEIQAAPEKTTAPQTYKVRDEIPISLEGTLTFSGSRTEKGMVYTCVGSGECVISYGTVVKGQIRAAAAQTTPDTGMPRSMDVSLKVSASNRPVIYWISGGALYHQATGSATQIASRVTDVVVDTRGRKLYYTELTGKNSGAIHRANLDGTGASVLKTLTATPQKLALDSANKKLYLTNGWGKIQRMNLDGTRYETNFITGLTDPIHLAVSEGHVYWTEAEGRVRAVNLIGAKAPRNIVTGAGRLTGLAAGGGKVFWAERTDVNRASIKSANPNGAGVTVVYPITASVYGLALDPANNQLYWTNGWGKIQRGLSAPKYQDVVTGLTNMTAVAIGGANSETAEKPPKSTTTVANKYDVNGDGTVDVKDSDALIAAVAARKTDAKYDVNGDGKVDVADIVAVTANRSEGAAGAPTLLGRKFSALEIEALQEQIDLLVASGDRSPAAMQTLIYLQQLIVMARPEKTQLLANYPNPFNPETWMPYELATDTEVKITIYNAQGVVIRTLHLGQQSAGYYTDRERAAYWDGQNALGERVASGIYFYQLETDTLSALRKMVILK